MIHKKVYGLLEIAEMLGESKQVIRYRMKENQFIQPQYKIAATPIWTYEQLEVEFKKHVGRYYSSLSGFYEKLLDSVKDK